MGSVLVEFEDGRREIVSWRSVGEATEKEGFEPSMEAFTPITP